MATQKTARTRKNSKNNRVVFYYRKSTDTEGLQENSIQTQKEACLAFAAKHAFFVVSEHTESGVSGTTPLAECPSLLEALASVASSKAKFLAVHRSDRASRSLAKLFELKTALSQLGASLVVVEDGLPREEDDFASIREVFAGLMAEQTVKLLRKRVSETLQAKKRRGEKFTRIAPYGFRWEGSRMVSDASEQRVIDRIKTLSKSGLSTVKVAKTLDAEGVVARKGTAFSQMLVWKILNREAVTA